MIATILEEVNADDWYIYISGEDNFRYGVHSEYKANRRYLPRPRHLEPVREYLILHHNANLTHGYEADDALGMASRRLGVDNVVLCSIDKDLLQIPGRHYNFVKKEFHIISEWDGLVNFYTQLMVGDQTDNIRGCPGVGKIKAPRILEGCNNESELAGRTWQAFLDAGATEDEFIRDANLIYILRSEDDHWNPPLDLVLES